MNSPYMGKFKVTQEFKGAAVHDGLDMVGIDSKEVHAVVAGTVSYAGWENPSNHSQGFGQYVSILAPNGDKWYYGHLSEICVNVGQAVNVTDIVGIEGSTGYSTGSHCHCCVRPNGVKANAKNVADVLGIPNALGTYDDGYAAKYACNSNTAATVVAICNGDKVSVKNGACDYKGGGLASWVYRDTFDVISVSGDRAVIGKGDAVTAAVNICNLNLK